MNKTLAEQNDDFRVRGIGEGRIVLTDGVIHRPLWTISAILTEVVNFNRFNVDNDPYGEHDFGTFVIDGHSIFWKIDCYDNDMAFGSPDPCDPSVTTRVLTIMLAEEY